jgi:hypothetical protein
MTITGGSQVFMGRLTETTEKILGNCSNLYITNTKCLGFVREILMRSQKIVKKEVDSHGQRARWLPSEMPLMNVNS